MSDSFIERIRAKIEAQVQIPAGWTAVRVPSDFYSPEGEVHRDHLHDWCAVNCRRGYKPRNNKPDREVIYYFECSTEALHFQLWAS